MLNVAYYLCAVGTIGLIGLSLFAYKFHQGTPHHRS